MPKVTNRSAPRGVGLSQRAHPVFYVLVNWESLMTPSRKVTPVYIAARIRINKGKLPKFLYLSYYRGFDKGAYLYNS
jgi:hypothetical protein